MEEASAREDSPSVPYVPRGVSYPKPWDPPPTKKQKAMVSLLLSLKDNLALQLWLTQTFKDAFGASRLTVETEANCVEIQPPAPTHMHPSHTRLQPENSLMRHTWPICRGTTKWMFLKLGLSFLESSKAKPKGDKSFSCST